MYKKTNAMKRNTILNVSVAVAVFFTAAIGAMSFKKSGGNHSADQTFYYNSIDMDEDAFHTVSNWTSDATIGNVGCQATGARPCSVNVAEGYSLSDVLGNKTNSEVLAIAQNRKPAP
jgi:hypothetical protein